MKLLLEGGADVFSRDICGNTALDRANDTDSNPQIILLLQEAEERITHHSFKRAVVDDVSEEED